MDYYRHAYYCRSNFLLGYYSFALSFRRLSQLLVPITLLPPVGNQRVLVSACNSVDQIFFYGSVSRTHHSYLSQSSSFPIIIDTGPSCSITPHRGDFLDGHFKPLSNATIGGLTSASVVTGIGRISWNMVDMHHNHMTIETEAILVPGGDVRLLSPQHYFQLAKGGRLQADRDFLTMTSPSGSQSVVFPYSNTNNLPIAHEANVAALLVPDFAPFTDQAIYAAVTDEANQNLTRAQKDLLLWHWQLGHACPRFCSVH